MNIYRRIIPVLLLLSTLSAAAAPFKLTRAVKSFDRSDTSNPIDKKSRKPITRNVGWLEYDVTVPESGWYTYSIDLRNSWLRYEFFVDGTQVTSWAIRSETRKGKKIIPLVNIFLSKGKHVLRLQRMGFPGAFPTRWALTASSTPETSIQGRLISHDVIRAGDNLILQLSGGGSEETRYTVMTRKAGQNDWVKVASVDFPATSFPIVKQVSIPCHEEGTFSIRLFHNDKKLPPSVMQMDSFAVVDTRESVAEARALKTRLVHTIDCVNQKLDGTPLVKGVNFWEAKGPSRVRKTTAGTYRESAPSKVLQNAPDIKQKKWGVISGIGYGFTLNELQKPYLLEVTFPDDDRRTVTVGLVADSARSTSAHGYHHSNSHGGYETGDWYPLTMKMKTLRMFFYPCERDLRVQLMSFGSGLRAAVSKIKIYQVIDGFPAGPPSRPDGRQLINWFEEMYRWRKYFKSSLLNDNGYEKEYVGLSRWLRFARYHGYTAVNPTELIYGGLSYRSKLYNFFYDNHYNAPRINALMCEKYGLKYIPQFHVRHPHSWFETRVMTKMTNHPDNAIYHRTGQKGAGGSYHPRYNPLHPTTQKYYLSLIKELCDQVGDSPSFAGFSFRLSTWYNNSWHAFPSLNWGYGDWMIGEFEKDTGIKVPGTGDSRFQTRFDFLAKNPANREKWLAWRAKRMTELFVKIRDLIRQYQPAANVYLDGGVDKKSYTLDRNLSFASNEKEGLREVGIDLDLLRGTAGVIYVPGHGFSRAKSYSRYTDQTYLRSLFNRDHIALGSNSARAFKISNLYFEAHGAAPVRELGLTKSKKYSHFSSAQAVGRNTLEKLALPLAEQDTSFFIEGGAQYMFLQDDWCREWLAAYKQLPALPFRRSETMSDPVALWSRTCADGFYFYLVNREAYPVKCEIDLKGCKTLTYLASQQTKKMANGKLLLTLPPFDLQSFRADIGTVITGTKVEIPKNKLELLKSQINFCDKLAERIKSGDLQQALPETDKQAFFTRLANSKKALAAKHYWRARIELMYPEMVKVFENTGKFPSGQYHRNMGSRLDLSKTGPDQLPAGEVYDPEALLKAAAGKVKLTASESFNPLWSGDKVAQITGSEAGFKLKLACDGLFKINIGLVAPKGKTGKVVCLVNGRKAGEETVTSIPGSLFIPAQLFKRGEINIVLKGIDGLGVYGIILEPVYIPLTNLKWSTIGPFRTYFKNVNTTVDNVKKAMDEKAAVLPFNINGKYSGENGSVQWQKPDKPFFVDSEDVDFGIRNGSLKGSVCYAAADIYSPEPCRAKLMLATDWWANAFINGKKIISQRGRSGVAKDGAEFNSHDYTTAVIDLKKGHNILIVKNHGGSAANWMKVILTSTVKLKISAPGNDGKAK